MNKKFFFTIIIMLSLVIFTTLCHAGGSMTSANNKIDEIFFAWVKKCFNRDTLNMGVLEIDKKFEKQYETFVKQYIKNNNGILFQNNRLEKYGLGLPYLYIDKKYNFAKYIPDFSDKELYNTIFGGNEYAKFEEIDMVFDTFYFKVLNYYYGNSILIVINRGSDSGNELSNVWFFTVDAEVNHNTVEYNFTLLKSDDETLQRYNNKIIEDYDMCDFYPERRIDGIGCEQVELPWYDIDKKTGDLFVYSPRNSVSCLRFVWNGERYVKNGLVHQEFYEIIEKRRGQE